MGVPLETLPLARAGMNPIADMQSIFALLGAFRNNRQRPSRTPRPQSRQFGQEVAGRRTGECSSGDRRSRLADETGQCCYSHPWRIAPKTRFWRAGYPPRYAALLEPSSPSFAHSSPTYEAERERGMQSSSRSRPERSKRVFREGQLFRPGMRP